MIPVAQAGAPGTGKTTFIQNLASAYGSQDDGMALSLQYKHTPELGQDMKH